MKTVRYSPALKRVLAALAHADEPWLIGTRWQSGQMLSARIYPHPRGFSARQNQIKAGTVRVLREQGLIKLESERQDGGWRLPDGSYFKTYHQRWVISHKGRRLAKTFADQVTE